MSSFIRLFAYALAFWSGTALTVEMVKDVEQSNKAIALQDMPLITQSVKCLL